MSNACCLTASDWLDQDFCAYHWLLHCHNSCPYSHFFLGKLQYLLLLPKNDSFLPSLVVVRLSPAFAGRGTSTSRRQARCVCVLFPLFPGTAVVGEMLPPPAGGLAGLASVAVRVFAASYLLNTYGVNVSQVRSGVTATAADGLVAAFFFSFFFSAFVSASSFSDCDCVPYPSLGHCASPFTPPPPHSPLSLPWLSPRFPLLAPSDRRMAPP